MKNHSNHADILEPNDEPIIFEDIEKKSEELKPIQKEFDALMSEARQIMSKQRKTSKERLSYI